MSAVRCFMLLGMLFAIGCGPAPGGGGTTHTPPTSTSFGKPTPISIKVSTWRAGSGKVEDRWKNVNCVYRLKGEANWRVLPLHSSEQLRDDGLVFTGEIPAYESAAGEGIEYYVTYSFDGKTSSRGSAESPYFILFVAQGR